jgi:hypothetical protein
MMNLALLVSLNIATADAADLIAGMIEDGTLSAKCDGDQIIGLALTESGRAMLPPFLPTAQS